MKPTATLSRSEEAAYAPLIWCGMALLIPRATLFGELSPFGIGLAACGGGATALLCLALGYLLAHPFSPMRYLLTIGVVGGCRWVAAAFPHHEERRWLPPVFAFVCCGGTGLWMLGQSGADPYRVLLILAESCLAAGSALFLEPAMARLTRRRDTADPTALILTGAVAVMAAATVEIGGFSPGRAVAALLVLLAAHGGQEISGCVAGCIFGGAMALSAPGMAVLGMALAVGGLTAGLCARLGRWCQSGLFLLTVGVVALGEADERVLHYMMEIAAACLLFALLPRRWADWLGRQSVVEHNQAAIAIRQDTARRLRESGRALVGVSRSVKAVSRRLRRLDGDAAASGRLSALQGAVEEQFAGTGELLEGLAQQLDSDTLATAVPRYTVESGIAQICCDGQRLCGDTARVHPTDNGVLAVLSDGMGCGGRAAVDSTMAVGIATRLWGAGFPPMGVLRVVNAALLVKGSEERLATLDMVSIHTRTGRMELYKAGAATTLLCSGGRVSRLERPGLPLGVLAGITAEQYHDTLSPGDVLLMVSDGALSGGVAAVEEILRQYPGDGSMTALAQAVCDAARSADKEHSDDITAVALRVIRR